MSGSATFTTVTSSSSMKTAMQTTPSVHHFGLCSIVELFNHGGWPAHEQGRPDRAAEIAQRGQQDGRRALVVEQVRAHLLGQAGTGGLAELDADAAAEDDRLDVEQVDGAGDAGAERAVRAVHDVAGELVALLEGARPDAGGQAVALALLHQLEEHGLLALVDAAAGLELHRLAPRVGLHAAGAPARALRAALLDDHVADLAGAAAAVPLLAVEDQAAADARAPEDAEQRLVVAPRAELELGGGRHRDVVA